MAAPPRIRVVLADDDTRLRNLVRDVLPEEYEVVAEAASGGDVIDLVRGLVDTPQAPDVVVLDYVMPDMDGFEAAEGLRELAPDLPVVVFSSLFDRTLSHEAEELGLFYVEKAAGVDGLDLALDAAIALRPPAADPASSRS
jgi:two-component system chemotaxis response regulator CheY